MRPERKPHQLRRRALLLGTAACLVAAAGCESAAPADSGAAVPEAKPLEPVPGSGRHAFRLSTRGRRASRALKRHAANKRFATPEAAEAAIPYPTAPVRVARITVSADQFEWWFADGDEVDLRHLTRPTGPSTLRG